MVFLANDDDDKKHQTVNQANDQIEEEEDNLGSMPNPDKVNEKSTLDEAHDVGLYEQADDEHPVEINIAKQVEDAEKAEWQD